MDVLYPVCAGIDVHRDTRVVTVSRAVERRARSETRTFGAVTEEVRALVAWLDEQEVPIVAMESTGVYGQGRLPRDPHAQPHAHGVARQPGSHQGSAGAQDRCQGQRVDRQAADARAALAELRARGRTAGAG